MNNMANREVCDLIFYDYLTKKPFLNLDYANVTTTELTGESVFAYGGKGHPKRVAFNGERGGTMTIETQIQTVKLWQLITGGTVSSSADIVKREQLTIASNAVTLSETPVAGSVVVYKADDDCGTSLANTVSTKTVTLTDTTITGDVIVYYKVAVSSGITKININATTFPKAFTVYGDTYMKTEDDDILAYKITAYKCAPQSNLTLTYSNTGDPGTITITCDLLADANGNLVDLMLIEAEGSTGA